MSTDRELPPLPEPERERFEAFMAQRNSKGVARRESMFDLLPDGTYAHDHVQRHWWTWQNANRAYAALIAEDCAIVGRIAQLEGRLVDDAIRARYKAE